MTDDGFGSKTQACRDLAPYPSEWPAKGCCDDDDPLQTRLRLDRESDALLEDESKIGRAAARE